METEATINPIVNVVRAALEPGISVGCEITVWTTTTVSLELVEGVTKADCDWDELNSVELLVVEELLVDEEILVVWELLALDVDDSVVDTTLVEEEEDTEELDEGDRFASLKTSLSIFGSCSQLKEIERTRRTDEGENTDDCAGIMDVTSRSRAQG